MDDLTSGLDFTGAPTGAGRAAGGQPSRRVTTSNVTYNLTQREMTLRDLEALQRRQDAIARVGRPR